MLAAGCSGLAVLSAAAGAIGLSKGPVSKTRSA
jgi:hypothetical protein